MALGPITPIDLNLGQTYTSSNIQAGPVGVLIYSDDVPLTTIQPLFDVNIWLLSGGFPSVSENRALSWIFRRQYRSSFYVSFQAPVTCFFQVTRIDTLPLSSVRYLARFGNAPNSP